jgi:adenylylsulfate kinase
MKVLIYGLPGAGKSYLAEKLCEYLGDKVKWINADQVRSDANDWDFSEEGRYRQKHRMKSLCEQAEAEGKIALADFVCPYESARKEFDADYNIFVDAIKE